MAQYPSKFGKYILLDRVNVGGMAEVFRAKPVVAATEDEKPIIAIKRILPSLVEDEEFIKMFIDEARIAVQLDHPNIVRIYELGKHAKHYYIAMEYLPSRDLRVVLDRLRSNSELMSISQAAHIAAWVCGGLEHAHRKTGANGESLAIIHRDVSPQNVLLTFDGSVKLIDFGIAKAANRASKTQAGVLKGKFGYMSPEQVRGLPIDHRSDIFAVGVLLYEMLTGERLFIGESDYSTLERVRNAEVIPPTTFNKKITPELERVVLRALAREPEERFQWAQDLADALMPFVETQDAAFMQRDVEAFMGRHYANEIRRENADLASIAPAEELEEATNVAPLLSGTSEVGDFEEAKTYVLEASAAGLELHGGDLDIESSQEQYDDSKTMVSMNPYTGEDPLIREARTEMPAGLNTAAQAPTPMSASTMLPEEDPVLAAMRQDIEGSNAIQPALSPAQVARPPATPAQGVPSQQPSVAQPEAHVPPQAYASQALPQAHASQAHLPQAPTPAMTPASSQLPKWTVPVLALFTAFSFIALIAALALFLSKGSSTGAQAVVQNIGETPRETMVFLDDQGMKESLPAQFSLSEGPHTIRVESEGFETLSFDVNIVESSQNVFPVSLKKLGAKALNDKANDKSETQVAEAKTQEGDEKASATWTTKLNVSGEGKKSLVAKVYRGESLLGTTPLELTFPNDDKEVELRLVSEGFESSTLKVSQSASADGKDLSLTLKKIPEVAAVKVAQTDTAAKTSASGTKTGGTTTTAKSTTTKSTTTKSTTTKSKSAGIPVDVGTRPYARVYLNGRSTGKRTPIIGANALLFKPGVNYMMFKEENGKQHKYKVTVNRGTKRGKIMIMLNDGTVRKKQGVRVQKR